MLKTSDLELHQLKTSQFIQEKATDGGCLCFLGLGSGKTAATLHALSELKQDFKLNKALIVSTIKVVDLVWPIEIMKWEFSKDLEVVSRNTILKSKHPNYRVPYIQAVQFKKETDVKLKHTELKFLEPEVQKEYKKACRIIVKHQRDYILKLEGDIFLMNVENMAWLWETMTTYWPFDTIVFDESSLFKNYSTGCFKAAAKASKISNTNICLTATPKPNSYANLWSQTFLVDQGERLGKNITTFRSEYTYQIGYNYTISKENRLRIQDKIRDLVLSIDGKGEIESGADAGHQYYPLTLSDSVRKMYEALKKDFVLILEEDEIIASSTMVLLQKLKQVCSGVVYTEDKKEVHLHELKIDAVREIQEAHRGESLIVVYEYISELKLLEKNFPEAVHISKFNQEKWDAGEVPILLTHAKSGGHGLNLQFGGRILIWYTPTIDLELYQQMNGRINKERQLKAGLERNPIYYHLTISDSIDESIVKARNAKDVSQVQLLDSLKEEFTSEVH